MSRELEQRIAQIDKLDLGELFQLLEDLKERAEHWTKVGAGFDSYEWRAASEIYVQKLQDACAKIEKRLKEL